MTFTEAMSHMKILYHRRISERVKVYLCQCVEDDLCFPCRAQFLNLVIHDEHTDRWVSLRLSTMRKIVKFIADKGFVKARKLFDCEIRHLDHRRKGV